MNLWHYVSGDVASLQNLQNLQGLAALAALATGAQNNPADGKYSTEIKVQFKHSQVQDENERFVK